MVAFDRSDTAAIPANRLPSCAYAPTDVRKEAVFVVVEVYDEGSAIEPE